MLQGCQADYRVCEACPEEDWSDWENVQRVYRDASGRCQLASLALSPLQGVHRLLTWRIMLCAQRRASSSLHYA